RQRREGHDDGGATPKPGAVRGTHVAPLGTLAFRVGRRVRISFALAASQDQTAHSSGLRLLSNVGSVAAVTRRLIFGRRRAAAGRAKQTQIHLRPWIIGMGGPTGTREIGPHRGGGGKREEAISQGRGGAGEEIVNAHLSLGLEIIPIVPRNYDGWTIRWSLPARRPTRDHEFESDFLHRRVWYEPDFLGLEGAPHSSMRPDRLLRHTSPAEEASPP